MWSWKSGASLSAPALEDPADRATAAAKGRRRRKVGEHAEVPAAVRADVRVGCAVLVLQAEGVAVRAAQEAMAADALAAEAAAARDRPAAAGQRNLPRPGAVFARHEAHAPLVAAEPERERDRATGEAPAARGGNGQSQPVARASSST
jgi:hypothetical protein